MDIPLVSILMPYYNDEQFLRYSIESVLNNDYQNFELILLNHATTDSSREIAHSYDNIRIKHIDMDINYGGGGGLLFEKMLSIANGKYIKPFCADDVLKKDGLKFLVEYMESNPNKDFAFGDMEFIDEKGNISKTKWTMPKEQIFDNEEIECLKLLAKDVCPVPFPSSIIKRVVIDNILPIERTYLLMFDMSIWTTILCKGYKIGLLDKKIVDYRLHERQISTNPLIHTAYSKNERESFVFIFLIIKSVSLAKSVFSGWCGNNRFDNIISESQDLDFYISYKFFIATNKISPYLLMTKMFNDKAKCKRIEQIFGYTIKDFREDIVKKNYISPSNLSFKGQIFAKSPRELNLFDLLFLTIRRTLLIPKRFIKFVNLRFKIMTHDTLIENN